MTTSPETEATPSQLLLDEEERPRFAVQRAVAAQYSGLRPEKMLVRRAKCVGEAHRRSESAELPALEE